MCLRRRLPAVAPNLSTKTCQTYDHMLRTRYTSSPRRRASWPKAGALWARRGFNRRPFPIVWHRSAPMSIHVFGIRHHGPGCARSLLAAMEALAPDIVLVEGPPDAHAVLQLMLDERMRPPVALLVYAPEEPQRAVFYPFTHFSPEWHALRFALQRKIPARFMDLPQAIALAV